MVVSDGKLIPVKAFMFCTRNDAMDTRAGKFILVVNRLLLKFMPPPAKPEILVNDGKFILVNTSKEDMFNDVVDIKEEKLMPVRVGDEVICIPLLTSSELVVAKFGKLINVAELFPCIINPFPIVVSPVKLNPAFGRSEFKPIETVPLTDVNNGSDNDVNSGLLLIDTLDVTVVKLLSTIDAILFGIHESLPSASILQSTGASE
jgi:hypothetical protein